MSDPAASSTGDGLPGLRGRIAAVTGAGGDIGRAISVRLAREGAMIVATDRTDALAASGAAAVLAMGGTARSLAVDVLATDQVAAIVPFAVDQLGRAPEIVVCCAGVQTFADVLDLDLDDWDRVFDINARGTFVTMRAVAPAMCDAGRGAIVAVASIQGRLGSRYYAHYAASKAAVLSLTKSFAVALAPDGVRVNSVAPGIVDTAMWQAADRELARIHGVTPGEPRRERIAQVPLRRAGTPEDVAAAVAFLASDDSSYITGECIHVCGGDVML